MLGEESRRQRAIRIVFEKVVRLKVEKARSVRLTHLVSSVSGRDFEALQLWVVGDGDSFCHRGDVEVVDGGRSIVQLQWYIRSPK